MLSTEYAIQMKGFTLFRDHADKRKYYYLPKGDVRIADEGRKLNFFAYVDSSMADKLEEKGGYLTLEVELGPSESELEELKKDFKDLLSNAKEQALSKKKAKGESVNESDWEEDDFSDDEFVLVPVPFKDVGRQTAVFSIRLTGKEADLMYQMLTFGKKYGENQPDSDANSTNDESNFINSQIAVVYDLTFKGIEPAHYVKIFVDFDAVEDFWDHHAELHGNFDYGKSETKTEKSSSNSDKYKISILADVDLDFMYRKLMNDGKIIVQHIDFTGKNEGSPLSADDPSAIELVKKLMSAELFEPAPLPKDDYSALKEVGQAAVGAASTLFGNNKEKDQQSKGQQGKGQQTPSTEGQTPSKQNIQMPTFQSLAGEDKKISKEEWLKSKLDEKDFEKYALHKENETYIEEEQYNKFVEDKKKADEQERNGNNSDYLSAKPKEVSAIEWNLGVRMAYSLKRRKTEENKQRTYIFNKQTAMDHEIHLSSMLSVADTKFDCQKQVTVGRLGEGPFRSHEIYFNSTLNFDAYHLEKILIEVNHIDTKGTVIELTKEKTKDNVRFDSEHFIVDSDNNTEEPNGMMLTEVERKQQAEKKKKENEDSYNLGKKLKYKVIFTFKSLSIKGFGEGKDIVEIKTDYKYASGKTFNIGPEDIDGIYPLKLEIGSLSLGKGISSAIVDLLQVPNSTDEEQEEVSIFNKGIKSDSEYLLLLNPEYRYKVKVQYNLEPMYMNAKVSNSKLIFTSKVLTTNEYAIEDPTEGITLIGTTNGADTFESIDNITVTLRQGSNEPKDLIPSLSKKNPEVNFVTNYKEGEPEEIIVESVKVEYRNGEKKDFTPNSTKFLTSTKSYDLNL